jgi:uracil-DNA glycosylase family 4
MVNSWLTPSSEVNSYRAFDSALSQCRACPRLVKWREKVARDKRASFIGEAYWGRPVPGFGDVKAWLMVLGLAPAAHGGNRTGRIFTGDRSGDWLFAAIHRAGLSNQPESFAKSDGLKLRGVRVTAAVHCAPPENAPTPSEKKNCASWLNAEFRLLQPTLRAVVALGSFAWGAALSSLAEAGYLVPRPRPKFGHAVKIELLAGEVHNKRASAITLIGSYHPSQQNTFTGRLTEPMLDEVFALAKACNN